MAKAAARRLKVFQAQFGFYDTVVAAPSQPAALRAWGVHQNLFAKGEAQIATDEAAVKAALEHPGTTLRRAVGSNDSFQLDPAGLPEVPRPLKRPAGKVKPEPAASPKPPADRTALNTAEAALHKLDEARKREEGDLREQQAALDAASAAAQSAYVKRRKTAAATVAAAGQAYRQAGGTD